MFFSIKGLSAQPLRSITAFLVIVCLSSTTGLYSSLNAAGIANPTGLWRTHDGGLVRFYNCGSQVCGRLIRAKTTLRHDANNPNPRMRMRPIKGITIIKSRKKTGPQKWVGTVYNINDGKTYHGSLKLLGSKKAQLTGCMSGGFCQSALWRKVSN